MVLALAACGGDDDGGSAGQSAGGQQESAGSGAAGSTGTGAAGSGADDGGSEGGAGSEGDSGGGARSGSGNKGNGEVPPLDLDDKAPAPKVGGKARGKAPDVSGPAKSAGDFSGVARQIYEASRYFCNQAGVEGMRQEYGIESKDPEDIAREAARRNQPRGYPEAVYFGCLEGLRKAS